MARIWSWPELGYFTLWPTCAESAVKLQPDPVRTWKEADERKLAVLFDWPG